MNERMREESVEVQQSLPVYGHNWKESAKLHLLYGIDAIKGWVPRPWGRSRLANSAAVGSLAVGAFVGATVALERAAFAEEGVDFSDMLARIPEFPTLVKEDPQTQFVPNRVAMLLDSREGRYTALRQRVIDFSRSQGWGDSMAIEGQWFYPFPIENNAGEIGTDTWAYAVNVLRSDNLSVYMKPGVKGQIWNRLPETAVEGRMTMAFAVNPFWEWHKTGGDPDVAPAVIVRNPGHPAVDGPIPVRVVHVRRDGCRFGTTGFIWPETDNLIVRLAREEAMTIIDFPVLDPHGNQEAMIELGSDFWRGPNFSEDINRVRVEDVEQISPCELPPQPPKVQPTPQPTQPPQGK